LYTDHLSEKYADYLKKNPSQEKQAKPLDDPTFLWTFSGKKLDSLFLLSILDRSKTDIIIVNWHSINNDPIYGSDRSFTFFSHYKIGLNSWVKKGGILILEAQCGQWVPVQESYNIFDESIVTTKKGQAIGKSCKINTKLKNHPILRNVDNNTGRIDVPSKNLCKLLWYPKKSEDQTLQNNMPGYSDIKFYQGWFEKYSNEWDPLIFTDDQRKKPIMLCHIPVKNYSKYVPIGALVITTMYLGSSLHEQLIENLFGLAQNNSLFEYCRDRENEKIKTKKVILCFSIVLVLFYVIANKINLQVNVLNRAINSKLINTTSAFIFAIVTSLIASIIYPYILAYYSNKKKQR